ncbi:glycosyltransferase family 39 protein [Nocardia carnea]|uniref:glycosyltransferase family 39 protein n=1 Tax=Nocardia carnea TaxID=37328 RepID=UPI0024575E72|nr:glycosyltransferase family 39 protein [Nocardia carnea]
MKTSRWLFLLATAGYLAAGLYLAIEPHYILGDSLSRVSAARSVLFSRDPHLAAIGFIFTPLVTIVQLPVVLLGQWWPVLTAWNITGVLVSAPFMAGAVVQVRAICEDRGIPGWLVWVLTALFAVNPMIVFYGANGMSEAPFVFLLCWTARRLIRWLHTDDVHDLCLAAVALALAYLTRYDALPAAAGVTVFVAVVTWLRTGGPRRHRVTDTAMDALLVAAPTGIAFVAWTVTSWLITGEPFQQFTSDYGNTSIVEQSSSGGGALDPLYGLLFSISEIMVLGPVLPVLIPVCLVLAWRRRDPEVLATGIVFGAVLAFATRNYMTGTTFPFLRFYISAIPLMVVLACQLVPPRGHVPARRPGRHHRPRRTVPGRRVLAPAVIAAVLVLATPLVTGVLMLSPTLSIQQYALQEIVFPDPADTSATRSRERRIIASFRTEREVARYIDDLGLPDASVLMDTVYGFAVYTATDRPHTYIIPSDQDFITILNDPAAHGVRYILAVPNSGRGTSDAVNVRYPTLYETGAEIATLELEIPNDGDNQPVWRLYRVRS